LRADSLEAILNFSSDLRNFITVALSFIFFSTPSPLQAQAHFAGPQNGSGAQELGASQQHTMQNRTSVQPDVMQGPNRSLASRQQGQFQPQRFQNFHEDFGRRR
jgi:hypothetical protein